MNLKFFMVLGVLCLEFNSIHASELGCYSDVEVIDFSSGKELALQESMQCIKLCKQAEKLGLLRLHKFAKVNQIGILDDVILMDVLVPSIDLENSVFKASRLQSKNQKVFSFSISDLKKNNELRN